MPTLAELQDALVNADKAGAVEDARRLADAIVAMQNQAAATPAQPTTTAPPSIGEKLYRGAKDPLDAAAQMFEKAMPEGFNKANRAVNNWLAEKLGIVTPMPEGGTNALIAAQEKEYQARRTGAGETGLDAWRLAGNVASPMNLAIAARAPQAVSLLGRMAVGAGQGAAAGALNPVYDGQNFWQEKAQQGGMGALVGGALPAATGALSRVLSPKASVNPDVAVLKAEGINPTIGQTLGGWANAMEEKAQSLPIMGDAIRYNRRATWNDLNRAGANRALNQVGEELPATVKPGNETALYVRKTLGSKYDELIPKLGIQADQPFMDAIDALKANVKLSNISPEASAKFERFIDNTLVNKFQGQGAMTGQTYKGVQSDITDEIRKLTKASSYDEQNLLGAVKQAGKEFEDLLIRSNPDKAEELKALNRAWANFKILQRASASVGAHGEAYTPAQLFSAVKANDPSKDKGRFSEGLALMQDLAGAGKRVLGDKIPDSGTTGRSLLAGMLGTAAVPAALPMTGTAAAGLGVGALTYLPQMQSLLRGAVSSRPASAQPIAESVRRSAPYLIPAATEAQLRLAQDQ